MADAAAALKHELAELVRERHEPVRFVPLVEGA